MPTRKRSLAKTATFRALATATTVGLVWTFTGNAMLTVGVGALDTSLKTGLYYFHERAWDKIKWEQAPEQTVRG